MAAARGQHGEAGGDIIVSDGTSILGRQRAADTTLSSLLPDAAILMLFASILGLFVVSSLTLESLGMGYLSPGGGILAKFHPSTLLAILALGLRCLATRRPVATAWRLTTRDTGCMLMSSAIIVMAIVGTFVTKTPVTPLVDTFVLPLLVFVLLRDLDPVVLRWLAIAIILVMSLNACLALIEVVRGSHFIALGVPEGATADPSRADATFDWRAEAALDWRARALLGHPLVNGMITGAFILCLAAPAAAWIPLGIRVPVALLESVAMFAFGARTALVFTLVFGGFLVFTQLVRAQLGRPVSRRTMIAALLCVGLATAGALALGQTGFFAQTIARFSDDSGSSATRLTMFSLLSEVPWSGLVFGPDQDVVATAQRLYGLEFGIESAWIGLILTYGLIVTGIAMTGLAAFSISIYKVGGRGTGLILIFFFILVSAAASLAGKITSFALIVTLILVFMRKDAVLLKWGARVASV